VKSPSTQQPAEGVANERRAIGVNGFAMRHQHTLDRPGQYALQRSARRSAIGEAGAPISRRARMGCDDAGEASEKRAPAIEPALREVLDQVGEDGGAAGAMEKDRLRHRETARTRT
jgi:hypothetical protein